MVKVALLADCHLVYKYHEDYNKFDEFKRVIAQIMAEYPECIIVLGDFFDKSVDLHRNLTHVEGVRRKLPIVDVIRKTGVPWYALIGNHEDEFVLQDIAETTPNFKFMRTDPEHSEDAPEEALPLQVGSTTFWFANTMSLNRIVDQEELLKKYAQSASRTDSVTKILLAHLDVVKLGKKPRIGDETIQVLCREFNRIFNGHEHVSLEKGLRKFKNFICVPACLPYEVEKGKGWVRKYTFDKNGFNLVNERPTPFGFSIFDTETLEYSVKSFNPNIPLVEVEYDLTGKGLFDVGLDWNHIYSTIQDELQGISPDAQKVIVIPVMTGTLDIDYLFAIDGVLRTEMSKTPRVSYAGFRKSDNLKIPHLTTEGIMSGEVLTIEDVDKRVLNQTADIAAACAEKGIPLTEDQINHFMAKINDPQVSFFRSKGEKETRVSYIMGVMADLWPELQDMFQIELESGEISAILEKVMGSKKAKKMEAK